MNVVAEPDVVGHQVEVGRMWWLFLVTGIAWAVIGFLVLSFDPTTPAMIGYLAGFVLLAAGVNELVTIAFVDGWKWLHGVLGALFLITGIMALLAPFQTFGVLALLIGWYLLFKGMFDIIFNIVGRHALPLWGLGLAAGIVELVIGVWAVGYPGRSAWLLVVWVGLGALIRGITEIVLAFQLPRRQPRLMIKDMSMTKHRIAAFVALPITLLLVTGCSQKYSAERDGKQLGEAICDLRQAETEEDAIDATDDVNEHLDDLSNKYALYTAEDRGDVQNNLADLYEHVIQGQPELAQQDLAVLERSAANIADDVNETAEAAWDGVLEGLSECTQ